MNFRNNFIFILSLVVFVILFGGCIKDDYADCSQGIRVTFYSRTPCQAEATYPEQIKDISLFVFDKDEVLVSYKQLNVAKLQSNFSQVIETESGMHSVVAWAGLTPELYDIVNPEIGVTQKQTLLFRLKRIAQIGLSIDNTRVYCGESAFVYVADAEDEGSVYQDVSVNMQEVTNRLDVTVEGLPNVQDYEVTIESNNGAMNVDGSLAKDDLITHTSMLTDESGVLRARFTLLKLAVGYNHTIVIRDKLHDKELYRASLLGTLLLKNPSVNLDCDHDFLIQFTTKDQCDCGTYTIMEIWVNNWLVHSYETEM